MDSSVERNQERPRCDLFSQRQQWLHGRGRRDDRKYERWRTNVDPAEQRIVPALVGRRLHQQHNRLGGGRQRNHSQNHKQRILMVGAAQPHRSEPVLGRYDKLHNRVDRGRFWNDSRNEQRRDHLDAASPQHDSIAPPYQVRECGDRLGGRLRRNDYQDNQRRCHMDASNQRNHSGALFPGGDQPLIRLRGRGLRCDGPYEQRRDHMDFAGNKYGRDHLWALVLFAVNGVRRRRRRDDSLHERRGRDLESALQSDPEYTLRNSGRKNLNGRSSLRDGNRGDNHLFGHLPSSDPVLDRRIRFVMDKPRKLESGRNADQG